MVRKKPPSSKSKPLAAAEKTENRRPSNSERSAYFARREAAKVLRSVLQGDSKRQAVGSIKSLVYSPSIKNKKATFALVCQTLKHLPIIKDVLESAAILNSKWKRQEELISIIVYDILFGQEISLVGGDAEKFLIGRKNALQSALAKLLVRKKVKSIENLIALYQPAGGCHIESFCLGRQDSALSGGLGRKCSSCPFALGDWKSICSLCAWAICVGCLAELDSPFSFCAWTV